MNVSYVCTHCDRPAAVEFADDVTSIVCPHCGHAVATPADSVAYGRVRRCLVCPCQELYVRKAFPQRLGVAIIVTGFIASSIAWYRYDPITTFAILFATALLDVVLYVIVGNQLQCYRCQAEYRGLEGLDGHDHFHLEVHERYRQQVIRLKEAEAEMAARKAREP